MSVLRDVSKGGDSQAKHVGKIYTICGPPFTHKEVADALSQYRRRKSEGSCPVVEVKYEQVRLSGRWSQF